jgi:hypothetical protein
MQKIRAGRVAAIGVVLALMPASVWAQSQAQKGSAAASRRVEEPDAQRTLQELSNLLDRYPPALRGALAMDPSLLSNEQYLAAYPALVSFLETHPEVARNGSFYVGGGSPHGPQDSREIWRQVLDGIGVFGGFGMAIGVVVWLIRTIIDYRRWSRLARVQTDAHTKLLDRFTANDDLLAYIQSPAGSKFLESSPIKLDAGPRSMGAPLGRILWSVQGGLVLMAGGIGLQAVSGRLADDSAQALHVLGVLGIALGTGFVISAIISFVISQRLGLIESPSPGQRKEREI